MTVSDLAETFGRPDGLEQDVLDLVSLLVRVEVLEQV